MNKVIAINIGGLVFNIDEQAYEQLKNYLDSIRLHFSNAEGNEEIIHDIECRIAEMLNEKLTPGKQSISKEDVEDVISRMGTTQDFAEASQGNAEDGKNKQSHNDFSFSGNGSRRLFRDPDNKIIGGVCSGVSAYFGIDPIWIRLFFVIIFFTFGSGLLLYIILWIIIPKAKTVSDRLEMRGERVNLHNIQRNMEEEINDMKQRFDEFKKSGKAEKIKVEVKDAADTFVDFMLQLVKGFAKFFAAIAVGLGIALLVGLIIYFFGGLPIAGLDTWFDSSTSYTFAIIAISLVVGVPVIMIIVKGFQTLFNIRKPHKFINRTASTLWFIGILMFFAGGFYLYRSMRVKYSQKDEIYIKQTKSKCLYLEVKENKDSNDESFFDEEDFNIHISGEHILNNVNLDIRPSDDSLFHLEKISYVRGRNKIQAQKNISKLEYTFSQHDSLLSFERYCSYSGKYGWKAQRIKLVLYVPIGKDVMIGNSVTNFLYDVDNTTNEWDEDMAGHRWKMTRNGLDCLDCGGGSIDRHKNHRHTRQEKDKEWEA